MSLEDLVAKQSKIMTYIKQDKATAREIIKAKGNLEKIKEIIINSSTDDFIIGIVNSPQYSSFVLDVADNIINEFPGLDAEIRDIELGIKKEKITKPKPQKLKKFKSRTSKGETYSKSYMSWTDTELTFIKSRKGQDTAETVKQFNSFFGESPRTESSIKTKIYRVRT